MRKTLQVLIASLGLLSFAAFAGEGEEAAGPSLYERLGAAEGIEKIVGDTIALHLKNESIAHYFDGVDLDNVAKIVADALNDVAYADDRQIASLTATKYVAAQGDDPRLEVTIAEIEDESSEAAEA